MRIPKAEYHPIRAPRGNVLQPMAGVRRRPADADDNLDPQVAEEPEKLIVYGGTGKAARTGMLPGHRQSLKSL
jgi:urocanate hydratase